MHIQCYFDLTLTLDADNFQKLLSKVYAKPQGYDSYSDENKYVDDTLASKGIAVIYHDSHKKKIKLKVNPYLILNEEPDSSNIPKLLQKLEKHVDRYFNSEYGLDDFRLSKMEIFVDIDVRERRKVADYLKVIQRIGKVKGFSPSSDLDDDASFCLEGNSNGIEFSIYDLEKIAKEQFTEAGTRRKKLRAVIDKAEGILRAEVRLTGSNSIDSFSDGFTLSSQMEELLKNSKDIFLKICGRIIPYGYFYKKHEAIKIIQKEIKDRKFRLKMIRLLTLIPEKKSLLLAQKAMNYRKIEEVMSAFFEINLSPITLSKRHEVKHLENLYEFL